MMGKNLSKIKQKVKQIRAQYDRTTIDPIRNIFAINSLGAFVIISVLLYTYVIGIISLFVSETNMSFIREIMRILECITISIVSYFFGGIFRKDKNNSKNNQQSE